MPNLIDTGAAWLGDQLKASAGTSVTVARGNTTYGPFTATMALNQDVVNDDNGFPTRIVNCDWTFAAADLPDGFVFRNGDRIVAGAQAFEAVPSGEMPCVERLDAGGVLLTVHSKQVPA